MYNLGFSGGNANIDQQGAPGFRDRFKLAMNNIGYPQQLRKIAIANGSINGTLTGSSGLNVLDFQYTFDKNRFFLGKSGLISRIRFTGSYGTNSEIFKYWRRTGLFASEEVIRGATFNNVCSIDAAPGGTFDTQEQIKEGLPAKKEQSGQHLTLQVNTIFPNHCFIPTISALAVNTGSNDFCQALYSKNLVCTGETPFASYYAPVNKNMQHVSFDDDLVTWLKGELNGVHQSSTVDYNAAYPIGIVSGNEPICTGATYQVSNLPAGTTVIWRIDNPGMVNFSPNTPNPNEVTLSKNGSNGTVTLYADVTLSCGSFTVNKSIEVGFNTSTVIEEMGGQSICYDQYSEYRFQVVNPEQGVNYKWGIIKPDGSEVFPYPSYNATSAYFYFYTEGSYRVFVVPYNTCGDGDRAYFDLWVNPASIPCDNGFQSFSISTAPNPTQGDLYVTIEDEKPEMKKLSKEEPVKMDLYDFYTNQRVRQWSFKNDQNKRKLDVKGLKKGQYVLTVSMSKYKQSKQIIIK